MALRHSHDPHLGSELDAVHARARLAQMGDEALEVGGARLSVVDDEVGVLLGYRGAPDAKALEAGRLDEARGVVSRRVGNPGAAAPLADRLRGPAPLEERAHPALGRGGTALEAQARLEEPFIRLRPDDLGVADPVLGRGAGARRAAAVDGRDGEHVPPGFPAEGAGVHRERTSERARDAREEFRGPKPPLDALPGDARTGDARLGAHRALAGAVEEIERAVRAHDHALQAAVAHQQVAPEPDPVDGHRGRERAQELCELDAIARIEEDLRRAPDVPGGVPAQGLIAAHPLAELRGDGEAHRELPGGRSAASAPGSACATALMLPAPMARMTSPSEITSLSAAASSSTFSTNSGSSTPRLRTARQMARPSAPAIGAPPAPYTPGPASPSAPESTWPKSSIRSRVRV